MQKILLYIFAFSALLFLSNCGLSKEIKLDKFYRKNATSVKKELFREEIGFELIDHLIVLPVKIENETYHFILDSARPTAIEPYISNKLNLKKIDATFDTNAVNILKIKVGNIDFLSNLSYVESVDTFHCTKIDGRLGANFMQSAIWKIDYQRKKITLTNYRDSLQKDSVKTINFNTSEYGSPYSNAYFNPYYDITVNFFTSESHSFCFSELIKSSLPSNQKYVKCYTKYQRKEKIDTASFSNIPYMRFESGLVVRDNLAHFESKQFTYSGNIGYDFFRNYICTFDWGMKKISLQTISKPENKIEGFGMSIFSINNKVTIFCIYEGMPAIEAGLHLGDEILSLNNLNCSNMKREQFCENQQNILKMLEKDEITLKVKQKDTTKTVTLKKKKMNF